MSTELVVPDVLVTPVSPPRSSTVVTVVSFVTFLSFLRRPTRKSLRSSRPSLARALALVVDVAAVDLEVAEAVEVEPTEISARWVVAEDSEVVVTAVPLLQLTVAVVEDSLAALLPQLHTVELPHTEEDSTEVVAVVEATETHLVVVDSPGGKFAVDRCHLSPEVVRAFFESLHMRQRHQRASPVSALLMP